MKIKPLLKRYIQFHKLQKAKDERELETLIMKIVKKEGIVGFCGMF